MYYINSCLEGKTEATIEDFTLLHKMDARFAMWKTNKGYHIQTTINIGRDFEIFASLANRGEKYLEDHSLFISR